MTKVLYNGECSICSFEINQYRKYSDTQLLDIEFENLHETNLDDWGVSQDEAKRRLHVEKDGKIYKGIDAFIQLWEDMPRYKLLAHIAKTPGLYELGSKLYDNILAPVLYKKNQWRNK